MSRNLGGRNNRFATLTVAALTLMVFVSPAGAAPYLRFERGIKAIRRYAAENCAERCTSWVIKNCRRRGPRSVGCSFVGRLPEGEKCPARLSAFLLPEKQGGSTLGVAASFNLKSCPSELFVPPGARE